MNTYLSDKLKVVSFISMMLVIFLHAYNLIVRLKTGPVVIDRGYNFFIQEFISQGLARIAVPLFFTISGYLFFLHLNGTLNEFKEKYRTRTKTLLIPYLFWSAWALLLCFLVQQLPSPNIFFTNNVVQNFSAQKWLSTLFIHPIAYQLWFLKDLMVLVALSPVIFWLIKKVKSPLLFLFLVLWLLNVNLIILSIEAVLFFVFGACLAILYGSLPSKNLTKKQTILCTILWFSVVGAKLLLIYYHTQNPVLLTMLHKSGILIGMVAIWGIYDSVLQHCKETILKMSVFSFFLYAFHEPVLMIFKTIFFYQMTKSPINLLLVYILAPLLTIALGIFVASQLKRLSPKFYGLITGGR